jgi:hypothetical protein
MTNTKKLVQNGKHFCVLPWMHFHSWPDGKVMPCCVADSTMPVSKIDSSETIVQMMNSEDYKKMRLSMMNDEPVESCKRCYDLEKIGTWTMRQSHNRRRGESLIEYIDQVTEVDGSLNDFKMMYMDVRFSNICNMKCRSCGPSCSSQWAQEYISDKGVDVLQKYFGMTKMIINSNEDQKFMKKLIPHLKDVTEVYFAGGEIIITPEHYECLEYWIDNDMANDIELTYTTNFSVLKYKDKDLISLWKKFPDLKIWASLDGMGEHAELIRKGTDWDRIEKNIRALKTLVPHAEFQITPTISIWNIYQFPKFFDYLIENKLISTNTSPRFNLTTHPWYANVMILPEFAKIKLIKLYDQYIEKYRYWDDGISNGFKMIKYGLECGSEKHSGKDLSNKEGILEFIKVNDESDRIRNESLLDVVPELKEVFEWAKS